MNFWNKYVHTVKPIPSDSFGQVNDSSETTMYIQMMENEEKKLQDAYLRIGQLYVSLYGDKADAEFSELIDQVKTSQNMALELKQKVQKIKGVQTCPNCKKDVPISASFCIFCGAAMPRAFVKPELEADTVVCSECGTVMKAGAKFCSCCGKSISLPAPEVSNSLPVQNKFCPNCGIEVDRDAVFCTVCGAKI